MLNITSTKNGSELIIAAEGRIDTTTAPQFEAEIKSQLDGTETLILDLEKLQYISSAGLRVMLSTQKVMMKQGQMILRNVPAEIMDILEVTGFSEILTIE